MPAKKKATTAKAEPEVPKTVPRDSKCISADQKALFSYGWLIPLILGVVALMIGIPAWVDLAAIGVWDATKWALWNMIIFMALGILMLIWSGIALWKVSQKTCAKDK